MNISINKLLETPDIVRALALKSAADTLREKGVLDFGPQYDVHLKIPASEAFKIAISPTTDAAETVVLRNAIGLELIKTGFGGLIHDFDQAIDQHLRIGLVAVPGLIPEPPKPEPGLSERFLKTLTTLEDGDMI